MILLELNLFTCYRQAEQSFSPCNVLICSCITGLSNTMKQCKQSQIIHESGFNFKKRAMANSAWREAKGRDVCEKQSKEKSKK